MDTRPLQLPLRGEAVDRVTAAVHQPARPRGPAVLLTHGAGGSLETPGLVALADAIARSGTLTVRLNLPYAEAGQARPPRAERMVGAYRQLLDAARNELGSGRAWVAGGKSYGGRVASLAAAEGMDVAGLLFYGYPLHPPGRPDRLRVDHWPHVSVPCLFLQGTRDPFCDLALLRSNLRKLPRRATLHVVEGGDHSLRVTRAASPDGVARRDTVTCTELGSVVAEWVAGLDA